MNDRKELDLNPLDLTERNNAVLAMWRDTLRRAEEAWAAMRAVEDPMPTWAAIDFVQEVNDNRDSCFDALIRSIASWLYEQRPRSGPDRTERHRWESWANDICRYIRDCKFPHAVPFLCGRLYRQTREWNLNTVSEKDHSAGDAWKAWCRQAAHAIRIARECSALWDAFRETQ